MNYQEARRLASQTAIWYHKNNIHKTSSRRLAQRSKKKPKYSDTLWAKLLTEAVMSFHNGLEDRIDYSGSRVASKDLFNKANDIVGSDAFQDIAMLVSAAGAKKQAQQYVDPQSFLPAVDLSGYLQNQTDQQVYGQFSTWMMQMSNQQVTQGTMHQATRYLQDLAKTPGLSEGFAYVLSSMGTEYQQLADKYTRQSGEGQYAGEGDLPTGIQIQGKRVTVADFVIKAFTNVEEQLGIK